MKQEEMSPADLAKMTVLYTVPGMEEVTVRRDVPYRTTESGPLAMDVYYPHGAAAGSPLPAVIDRVWILGRRPPQRLRTNVQGDGRHRVLGEADRRVGDGRDSLFESRAGGGRDGRAPIRS